MEQISLGCFWRWCQMRIMFICYRKSFGVCVLIFAALTDASLQARTLEIFGRSATLKVTPDLQIIVNNNNAIAIMVRGSPLAGSLNLTAGTGVNAKHGFDQIISSYRMTGFPILSRSLRGNNFSVETRTGASNYDLRRIISGIYVPQEPGSLQKAFLGVADIPNASWDSAGGRSLRAALRSFKPKTLVFKDAKAPSLFVADPARPVSTFDESYVLQGLATDNVSPVLLQVRAWAPDAAGYSAWSDTRMLGTAKSKRWTYRLPMQRAKGLWRVQIRVVDAARNQTQPATVSITRL